MIIDLTDQQLEELKKMIKVGMYKTKTEAIRDAVRKLIEEKRRNALARNGGSYECF